MQSTVIAHALSTEQRERMATGVKQLLADTYVLYLKTQGFHWNVVGPNFIALHELFAQHYTELQGAIDTIAERIRILGAFAPATFGEFRQLSSIEESPGKLDAFAMVEQLAEANEGVARTVRSLISIADEIGDESTLDMLAARLRVHEKAAWMLRAHLA